MDYIKKSVQVDLFLDDDYMNIFEQRLSMNA